MLNNTIVYEAYPKVPVQQFIPELSFEFSDMPEDGFAHFVLSAINTFARRSNVLRRKATIRVTQCVDNYLLEPQDCVDIVAIMGIRMLRPTCGSRILRLTGEPGDVWWGVQSWFEAPNVIHITNTSCNSEYEVYFSVAPRYDACEVDEILLTQYSEAILAGARAKLYGLGNKPWSSLQRMEYHERLFDKAIRAAAVEALTGGQRGAIKARRPRMF